MANLAAVGGCFLPSEPNSNGLARKLPIRQWQGEVFR